MGIPHFSLGYPPDGSNLGNTKTVMRGNLDGTFQTVGIDHVNNNGSPGSNPAGYHTIIHEVTQTSVNTVAGVNQVFSGIPGTLVVNSVVTEAIPNNNDTQLYSLTGAAIGLAGLSQMTGSSALSNGFVWCAGILLMWGTSTSPTVNFATGSPVLPDFPTQCLNVQATMIGITGTTPPSLRVSSKSKTGFTTVLVNVTSFYWFAIGN